MWTVAGLNKKFNDALGNYNSLNDPHLAHFFGHPSRRKQLIQSGLITEDGIIVPEKILRLQDLALERRANLYKLLDEYISEGLKDERKLEHLKDAQCLEEQIKADLLRRAKILYSNTQQKGQASSSTRDSSARRNLERLHLSNKGRSKISTNTDNTNNWSSSRTKASSYVPHRAYSNSKPSFKSSRPKSSYGRRKSGPETVPDHDEHLSDIESLDGESLKDENDDDHDLGHLRAPLIKLSLSKFRSKSTSRRETNYVNITYKYNGVTHNNPWPSIVEVMQQPFKCSHCLVLFKRLVKIQELFTISIRPHPAHSFCIIFFVDNVRDFRVNTCCEYKHRPGSHVGHFTVIQIDGGSPCERCINFTPRLSLSSNRKSLTLGLSPSKTGQVSSKADVNKSISSSATKRSQSTNWPAGGPMSKDFDGSGSGGGQGLRKAKKSESAEEVVKEMKSKEDSSQRSTSFEKAYTEEDFEEYTSEESKNENWTKEPKSLSETSETLSATSLQAF